MPNEFDTFAREFATPFLAEQFGEREPVVYRPPGGGDSVELVGVTLHEITTRQELDPTSGDVRAVETRLARCPAEQLAARGITSYQRKATVMIGEEEWHMDAETSKFRGPLVTLGLMRKPRLANQEMRRGTGV